MCNGNGSLDSGSVVQMQGTVGLISMKRMMMLVGLGTR